MKVATLCFLVKKNREGSEIDSILLGLKKRGFGEGKWNGFGGKVDSRVDTSIEDAVVREVQEEIEVDVEKESLKKVAFLHFEFPHKPEWSQIVHAFFTFMWKGNPVETEEMKPKWFAKKNIPYDQMWWDDKHWLPRALKGELITGSFQFGDDESILKMDVKTVDNLT